MNTSFESTRCDFCGFENCTCEEELELTDSEFEVLTKREIRE